MASKSRTFADFVMRKSNVLIVTLCGIVLRPKHVNSISSRAILKLFAIVDPDMVYAGFESVQSFDSM